jgi:hypothetical protein
VRDVDLRQGLTLTVRDQHGDRPHVLVPEVDIRWTVPARMDALLVSDRLVGFEIKSDVDSLRRLPRQVQAYGAVVERAHLLVGERPHYAATEILPDWWGVWSATWDVTGTTVALRRVRAGRLNPNLNLLAVTTLLTRRDLTNILQAEGPQKLAARSVDDLRATLVCTISRTALLRHARSCRRARGRRRGSQSYGATSCPSDDTTPTHPDAPEPAGSAHGPDGPSSPPPSSARVYDPGL